MSLFILGLVLGFILGFLHARFSDYAKKTGMWPYQKTEEFTLRVGDPYREPAKVPFMVTKDQEQALADLGYTKSQRAAMAPAVAHKAIEDQKGPKIIRKPTEKFTEDCGECGAVFEYAYKDTVQGIGGRDIKCPSCGSRNFHYA